MESRYSLNLLSITRNCLSKFSIKSIRCYIEYFFEFFQYHTFSFFIFYFWVNKTKGVF